MEPVTILYVILGILVVDFIIDQGLDYLNLKAHREEMPPEAEGIYDPERYRKSQQYHRVISRFSFLTSSLSFVVAIAVLSTGFLGVVDSYLREYFSNPIVLALAFFGAMMIASDVVNTPFQWYRIFVIEERFGFNKTTPRIFMTDKLKGYLLSAILGGGILSILLYLIISWQQQFWIIFWVVISLFILFMNMFYTSLILPLFNKLTPLEDGELKSAIQEYCKGVKFPLTNIFVIDGSKRSKKANAFFTGIGKRKKIVLYDTLIANHTTDELVAVLAHEVGHYKKKHIIWGYVISLFQVGFTLFIMSLMIFNENLSIALGAEQIGIHLNLLAFGLLYSPISRITGILSNILSRKNEYEADAYAVETFPGTSLENALKKLSADNLSNLLPHKWYVFVNYSHPPLLKRLGAIRERVVRTSGG